MAKVLFITQKVDKDDDVLGVYHSWIEELAKRIEKISVICLYRGRVQLPSNVSVYSLGKEEIATKYEKNTNIQNRALWSILSYIRKNLVFRSQYVLKFYKYVWRLRNEYDVVFVHMNPEYVILGAKLWKLLGKKIILWYAHYLPNLKLRIAEFLADKIVTSTRLAYPLKSRKLEVLQQGIDTSRFKPANPKSPIPQFRILFLGRIAPVKHIDILLKAIAMIRPEYQKIALSIIGAPTPGKPREDVYYQEIKKLVLGLKLADAVNFHPPVPNYQTPDIYNEHDLFINLTDTGSFDKTTLEAMACGLPVIVSNKAFLEIFPAALIERQMFREKDSADLAKKIKNFLSLPAEERQKIAQEMRRLIVEKHSLSGLSERLAWVIKNSN